jgi:hypothetical protein
LTKGEAMRRSALLLILVSLVAAVATAGVSARHERRSPLDGRWKLATKPTSEELIAKGMTRADAEALNNNVGTPAMEYRNGHFRWFDLATGITLEKGTYVVDGYEVTFARTWKKPGTIRDPRIIRLRWSVFRDRLTFSDLPGRMPLPPFTTRPWTRVS